MNGRVLLQFCFLALTVLLLMTAALMTVPSEQQAVVTLFGWPLPELCQTRRIFGWDCPGCGLTRSFIYMAHGEVEAAFRMHAVGASLFVLLVICIPLFVWNLGRLLKNRPSLIDEVIVGRLAILFTVSMLVHWIVKLTL